MGWTDDKIADLKRLWAEGKSTAEIGKIIDMSKNAVVGKAHRLNLKPRPSPIKRAGQVNDTALPKQKSAAAEIKDISSAFADGQSVKKGKSNKKGVELVDLTMHTCRWPIGDPKDPSFHFCGKEVELGKPYCAEHLAMAFVGIKR